MTSKLIKLSLLLFSVVVFLIPQVARADTGPKPTMDFQFRQEMTGEPPLTITSGILFECEQPDCSDAMLLEEGGPQGFFCELNSCYATAYGFARYHQIELEFSDGKTRQSNIFKTVGFDSKYMVTIRPDDLLVEARFSLGVFPRTATILVACICAIVGIGLVVALSMFLLRRSKVI